MLSSATPTSGTTPTRIEKRMSLTLTEFQRSLVHLAPEVSIGDGQTEFTLPLPGGGAVSLSVGPEKRFRLSPLLSMPQRLVTLEFSSDSLEADQATFIAAFDKAFQRGGG